MKVEKVVLSSTGFKSWMVLDNNYLPIQAIESFIRYMETLERSPNTIKNYAHHLKLYWEFLDDRGLEWTEVKFGDLQRFVAWLRRPAGAVEFIALQQPKRSRRTVNTILSAVYVFYEYQMCLGSVAELPIFKYVKDRRTYKPFLYGIGKGKQIRKARLKLKEGKEKIKTLSSEQVQQATNACNSYRDRLLIQLLYQTGMRIGGALGLRHSDIDTIFKKLQIIPREDNVNDARAKFDSPHFITGISQGLIGLYIEYVSQELVGIDSDYVFVNLHNGEIGRPMTYNCVLSLFKRLSNQVGFYIRPHMLRHTHATELLKNGLGMEWVQVRLKHKSVQTTIDIYGHLTDEELADKIEAFNKKHQR